MVAGGPGSPGPFNTYTRPGLDVVCQMLLVPAACVMKVAIDMNEGSGGDSGEPDE